ncbi:MAG: cache domain-containing protein [Thermodesulfovibrio sp.]|uniref:cache domain-containing protein n=1 Tax=unclassified Thermodesulfovibrio TaxID=2645936 RepID=UPI00083A45A0|nr:MULTISPECIES: cache domain-containing protein [unclassified Thermodesulfovibrio]MDI1470964.1 cache domain-containing protein [Thermodesulfovibrio sp. 1176]MDI6713814.1 cache domain-containing protein [Thermodesulfovibrio sp.]ODA43643.1 Methyl-accepting chemotaxis protein [Thermodesulfovibrio sp. N1]
MRIELGLRAGIALPLLATLIAGMSILVVFNYITQVNLLKEEENRSIQASVNTAQVLLETATIHYQQMAHLISHMPDVQEAVNKKDRNILIDKFLPAFNSLKENFGLAQFHFHIPPAVSLVRLHDLSHFGDDISKDRKTVVQVESTHKGVRGIEIGLGGVGLRGVEPVFYKGRYVGSVDFGGGLKTEIDQIKKAINADLGVVVYKELLSGWTGLKDVKHVLGEWVSLYFTQQDPKMFISETSLKRAVQSKEKYYTEVVSLTGKEYIVVYSPFKDFSGRIIGYIYIVKERILSPVKIFTILGINILVYLAMLTLIALLIGYGMNKYVINPIIALTKITDEISMGKVAQKVEVKDARGEIAILAKAIERMRITMKKLLE